MDIIPKEELLKWFSQNLKRIRKEKGYSQEALSEIAGIDLSYYGAVERGQRAITIYKLFQITNALGIPMRYLFSGEPGRPQDEREDNFEELIKFLRKIDEGDLVFFKNLLEKLIEWKNAALPR